jgi:hypothetical protein
LELNINIYCFVSCFLTWINWFFLLILWWFTWHWVHLLPTGWTCCDVPRGVYFSINFDSSPPPSFQIWFFSPYLYYISLKGLYLIVILWHSIFEVLWPMGANGGIDKHRQNEIKMKENWRKWNFEGNFNALNFDKNQEKNRKNHFGKWKHWFSRITHGNFSLLFPLPFHFFLLFFDFLP